MTVSEKEDFEIISYIESKGFYKDIEDIIWYTKDYSKRIAIRKYSQHHHSTFYNGGGFSRRYATDFTTLNEIKKILEKACY